MTIEFEGDGWWEKEKCPLNQLEMEALAINHSERIVEKFHALDSRGKGAVIAKIHAMGNMRVLSMNDDASSFAVLSEKRQKELEDEGLDVANMPLEELRKLIREGEPDDNQDEMLQV